MTDINEEELISPFHPEVNELLYQWDKDYTDNFDSYSKKIEDMKNTIKNWNSPLFYLYRGKYLRKMQLELEILKKEQVLGKVYQEDVDHYNKEYGQNVDPENLSMKFRFPKRGFGGMIATSYVCYSLKMP